MAFTSATMDRGRRTVYQELVDRPARDGAARLTVPVLLPYSKIEVDGQEYVETNSTNAISEGGGFHAVPSHGILDGIEYRDRSNGIDSVDVSSGTTRSRPESSVIHKFGWI